ncbi:N-acetylmuramoyl-L-alanine amidase [Tumebacillus sp. BK434]|uniref:N-acetylmuramoyl-L-alanine amidase family protein n=1 Tax=Tumebacillus sp. BK434 TaxID=2512169 RepID=UPI00140441CC|nr:N-acetylmuramoyl-L-alanine amidase [Tumebacillus sp. BK434]
MKKCMHLLLAGLLVIGIVSVAEAATPTPAVSTAKQYNVFQRQTFLKSFVTFNEAVAYAKLWDHSSVVKIAGNLWLWDNYPRFHVFQGERLLKEFTTQQAALDYAKLWARSSVRTWTGSWLWDNYPKYRVFQGERMLREYKSFEEAVAYARLWAGASVRQISDGRWVWDNFQVKTLVLDPGHGGRDPGAIALDGTQEKDLTLAFGLQAKAELVKRGYNVVMVRETDMELIPATTDLAEELQARVDQSKVSGAHLFVSLHANSFSSSGTYGTETYYNTTSSYDGSANPFPEQSRQLAGIIQKHAVRAMGTYNRGAKDSNFYVLRKNTVPAALVEIGFLSNAGDLKKLEDTALQQKFAVEMGAAIDEYFSVSGQK